MPAKEHITGLHHAQRAMMQYNNGLGITDGVLVDGSKNRISHISGARAYGLNARCVKD